MENSIPEKDFKLFKALNSYGHWFHQGKFYELKTKILKQHGKFDGYDRQEIKTICNSCGGTGVFVSGWKPKELCWGCMGAKIYETKYICLERYLLNGEIFHNPIGREYSNGIFQKESYGAYFLSDIKVIDKPVYKDEIFGLVKHEKIEGYEPNYSLLILSKKYDNELFFYLLKSLWNGWQGNGKNKFRSLYWKTKSYVVSAKEFFGVKKEQGENYDLPF